MHDACNHHTNACKPLRVYDSVTNTMSQHILQPRIAGVNQHSSEFFSAV
jgi:hypothetical protein